MNLFIKKYVVSIVCILLVISAYLSYNNNIFHVTSDKLFHAHQVDSEQLVLDGLLNRLNGNNSYKLGRYTRPEVSAKENTPHDLYKEKNIDGVFKGYKSQFGLQVYLFKFLSDKFSDDVNFLQSITALFMSVVIGLFFISINREFSLCGAILFCVSLILSPWVVIFARNLYWIEATWFLPVAITFAMGKRSFFTIGESIKIAIVLVAVFLLKFLCGYEYISTIGLSACISILYYAIKYKFGIKRGLLQVLLCAISFFVAFIIALIIHANALSENNTSGFEQILLTAEKRLSSNDPEAVAKLACVDEEMQDDCQKLYIKSLKVNRFLVVARYFPMPHFVPWLDLIVMDPESELILKDIRDKPKDLLLLSSILKLDTQRIIPVGSYIISSIAFLIFNFLVFRETLKHRDALSVPVVISFVAPISWFFIAKGHSAGHTHMNYVLWYLIYIPFGILLLSKNIVFNKKLCTH